MNPRLAFVVFGSFYFSVLVVSYLLVVFYPFFAPYGWVLVPVLANFCVGYFVRDVVTVVKMIIAGFSLQVVILLALLYSSSVFEAFFAVTILSSYYTLQVPLGITVSLVGIAVRREGGDIIAVCVHLVKKMKQIIETLLSRLEDRL